MIQLLFTVLAGEAVVAVLLLLKTPLRRLLMAVLDRLKRGRAPIMVKTVAGTVFVVLSSSVYSIYDIGHRAAELDGAGVGSGMLTPTDQVLMSRHILEASLMGYSLFLAFVIDRLHHILRERRRFKKNLDAATKQNKTWEEDTKKLKSVEREANEKEVASLKERIKKLEKECEAKSEETKVAEDNALALKKQSEGLLMEYDRLLEDNQSLRTQLQSIDLKLSHSEGKKSI